MKKIILLFAAMLAITVTNAQQSKSQKADAAGRATTLTNEMATVVSLTDAQKPKVQLINLENIKLKDLNQEKAANNPNQLAEENKRIMAKWEQEMNGVVTPEQMKKWKDHKALEKTKK
ncbi:MAG: hypothetical protein H0X46_10335 [Bacteroidetes bacterium]|nr:hypothetical protein [Bacteroidota bacterium]